MPAFPGPTAELGDERDVLLGYLDFFRTVAHDKVAGMSSADQARSRLASGWTPLELLNHLRHVERRWLVWGFEGEPVADPWADRQDDRWHCATDFATVARELDEQAATTRRVVTAHRLDDVGAPSDRWDGEPPATLRRVMLHLVQEYARHCGHLDIVRELADGSVGEDG
jgi:uncharacterized damage-inducible protein DinB